MVYKVLVVGGVILPPLIKKDLEKGGEISVKYAGSVEKAKAALIEGGLVGLLVTGPVDSVSAATFARGVRKFRPDLTIAVVGNDPVPTMEDAVKASDVKCYTNGPRAVMEARDYFLEKAKGKPQ